jgi:hypothetical protein
MKLLGNHTAKKLVLGAGVAVAAIVGGAVPAFAHTATPRGTVACTSGQQVVTWKVTNSETASGHSMTIVSATTSQGTVTGFPSSVAPGATATGTSTFPGTTSGSVTLTVHVRWEFDGFEATETSSPVSLPGNCSVPLPEISSVATIGGPALLAGAMGLALVWRRRRTVREI